MASRHIARAFSIPSETGGFQDTEPAQPSEVPGRCASLAYPVARGFSRLDPDVRAAMRRILWVAFVSCALLGQILGWIPTWFWSTTQAVVGILTFNFAFVIVMSKRPTLGTTAVILLILIVGEWWCLDFVFWAHAFSRP